VDDRLLHGQVALAWGRYLDPKHFLLADDRLANDPDAVELYALAAPDGCTVTIAPVELVEAGDESLPEPAQSFLLVRGLEEAARCLRAGVPGPLNLGGIHLHPGARRIFPYLYLTPAEETVVARLSAEGHLVYAQDLPQSPRRAAPEWLQPEPGAVRGE
jgi:mannose/fructose/N-acetylgalactosamine-specific phosphotransferase system component IIB